MDFPRNIVVPPFIHSYSRWMNGSTMHHTCSTGVPAAQAWSANVAIYIPMLLPFPYRVARAFWYHGSTVSGNVDIGIYSASGALIWSAGSTANSGSASLPQYVTVSPELLLTPGRYWMAYTNSGTTNQYLGNATGANNGRLAGLYQQATALPLPAAATFAAYAAVGYPLIGITNTTTGF